MLKSPQNFHRSQNTSYHLSQSYFSSIKPCLVMVEKVLKTRRRNLKMREDSAFKEDESTVTKIKLNCAIFISWILKIKMFYKAVCPNIYENNS